MRYIIGAIVAMILTVIVRFFLCCACHKPCQFCVWCKELIKSILRSALYILSWDFYFAKICKDKIKKEETDEQKQKDKLAAYIRRANVTNLIISSAFCLLTYFLKNLTSCKMLLNILLGVMIYRFVSRTLEINVSFLLDCIKARKASNLNRTDRIMLAFLSLVEEAVLFLGVYTFAFAEQEWLRPILWGLHSFILSPANVKCAPPVFSFIAIYQVMSSVILLTISFATYISNNQNTENAEENTNTLPGNGDFPGENGDKA